MCRIAAIGDLVTHTRPQLECSAVTKFGIEFSLDNIQYVSEISPVIRRIASAIFDQAHPQIALLVLVIFAHMCEALRLFKWMRWGGPHNTGHYLDLASLVLGLTLFPLGYLLRVLVARHERP